MPYCSSRRKTIGCGNFLRHCVTQALERPERLTNVVFLQDMESHMRLWYYARGDGNAMMPLTRGGCAVTCQEVLAQVINWLQKAQIILSRGSKCQFALDDNYLEDLKEALLYAYPQVIDNGRGLVWTGPSEVTSAPSRTPSQPAQRAESPREPSPLGEALPSNSQNFEAEQHHLTVLFCDLVDLTALNRQLALKDLREVVRAYQETCAKVITHFSGDIAQCLGGGLLVYLGYPRAHEDEALWATQARLTIYICDAQCYYRPEPYTRRLNAVKTSWGGATGVC